MLMNIANFGRGQSPLVTSQLNIRPVFDVNADVQGRDLASAAAEIDKVLALDRAAATSPMTATLSGQVETMRESFAGLFSGMALAVALVYLALVINFQSWIDPLIVLGRSAFHVLGRRHVDVVSDPDAFERAGLDGLSDVHWPHFGQ